MMRADTLRTVLLIKAIEESDRAGEVIPFAERAAATREASRAGATPPDAFTGERASELPAALRRQLVRRARLLRDNLAARYPVLDTVEALAAGSGWLHSLVLVLALLVGMAMSALDGSRRINVLAFPLAGLLAWNLFVYLWVLVGAFERKGSRKVRPWARAFGGLASLPLRSLLARSSLFNAPLADALRRFAGDWREVAGPMLLAQATRLLHLAAAAVAIGLVIGLYLRGVVWRYEAGWESTFLDAGTVRAITAVLYGPAAALTGIELPGSEAVQALRWEAGRGGGAAAPWIHLIAVTAALYIVLPRLALAFWSILTQWRHALSASLPPSIVPYLRTVFGAGASVLGRGIVGVTPYAYEPSSESVAGLAGLLPAALGDGVTVDLRDPVRYGDEEAFVGRLARRTTGIADTMVLLFTLAATPEDENHGAMLNGVRDAMHAQRSAGQALVIVDAGPYAERLGRDSSLAGRLAERERLWCDFVASHGLRACVLDLRALSGTTVEQAHIDAVRAALWSAPSK